MIRNFFPFLFILISKISFCNNLYDTNFYNINFISDDVERDKINKISNIKFDSINNIFNNILTIKDYNFIKKTLDEDSINILIKNIIIENEKIINNNYSANIKINYNKKKIIEYLRLYKIGYIEHLPNNYLIIINEKNELSNNLFSKNNSYYKFLNNNSPLLNFYKIPELNINDRYLLTPDDIKNNNLKKISQFVKKYEKNNAILLISKKNNNEFNYSSFLFVNDNLIKIETLNQKKYNYFSLFNNLKDKVQNTWKEQNLIQNNSTFIINCDVNYFNLLELRQIKMSTLNISTLKKIKLNSISFKKNNYSLEFYGSLAVLPQLFNKYNLEININKDSCKINLR